MEIEKNVIFFKKISKNLCKKIINKIIKQEII